MPGERIARGTLNDGLAWIRAALADLARMVRSGGWLFDVETLAAPWARSGASDPVRRLTLPELTDEITRAGFAEPECVYRFRDRVIVKSRRP